MAAEVDGAQGPLAPLLQNVAAEEMAEVARVRAAEAQKAEDDSRASPSGAGVVCAV